MVDKSLHCDDVLTPEKKAKIQNLVNLACRAVEENAPEKIKELQKEVSEIWLW